MLLMAYVLDVTRKRSHNLHNAVAMGRPDRYGSDVGVALVDGLSKSLWPRPLADEALATEFSQAEAA